MAAGYAGATAGFDGRSSRADAQLVIAQFHEAVPLETCGGCPDRIAVVDTEPFRQRDPAAVGHAGRRRDEPAAEPPVRRREGRTAVERFRSTVTTMPLDAHTDVERTGIAQTAREADTSRRPGP